MYGTNELSVSEAAVLEASFPWPETFREPRKTPWNPQWTGKEAVSSWVAALAFLSEQAWVMKIGTYSFLSSNYLIHKICLVNMHIYFSGSVSASVQVLYAVCLILFLFPSHIQKNFNIPCIDLFWDLYSSWN